MRRIDRFQCLEVNTNSTPADGLVILFHGYGADAYDLQTLSDVLGGERPVDFLFPQGPLEVPIGPGWTGRAWWPIDVAALEKAAVSGEPRDLSLENPEGLKALRPSVQKMLSQCGYPLSKIVIGGFSQGAMLATDTYLRTPEPCAGLMILSGALLCSTEWKQLAAARSGQRFFQSHGKNDSVLSFRGASQLETALTQGGMKGSLQSFNGGHEIPMSVIQSAQKYIQQSLFQK